MRALTLLGWAVLAVLVAGWLAVVEVLWLPWRVGGVPVPISVLAAAGGNLLLVGALHRLSRSRLLAVLPAAVWLGVVLLAAQRRPEGDLLITGGDGATSLVNTAFLLLGVLGAAFAVGRVLTATPGVSRRAAGSGTGGAR